MSKDITYNKKLFFIMDCSIELQVQLASFCHEPHLKKKLAVCRLQDCILSFFYFIRIANYFLSFYITHFVFIISFYNLQLANKQYFENKALIIGLIIQNLS